MGALLLPDDLHERDEFLALTGDVEGVAAVGAWTLSIYWLFRERRPTLAVPADRISEVLATPRIAARLVEVGLWSYGAAGYSPVLTDFRGEKLWRYVAGTRPSRPAIPPEVRAAVMLRDAYRCVWCDNPDDLTLDHIFPWSRGGPDIVDNLRVLCRSCNSRKGARVE